VNAEVRPDYLYDIAYELLDKHEEFVKMSFQLLKGTEMIETRFNPVIGQALDRVIDGEIKRLIINIPPRHGKTLTAVQSFVARGFAINPKANFLHTSYSDTLVKDNSTAIRDIIQSADYQRLYPYVQFKQDSKSKGLWKTTQGGTFLAAPSGGTIIGFGAGIIGCPHFSGCLLIDDPLKPGDARSERTMKYINSRWEQVFKSRLADQNTPVILIMQRIAENDFTNELLNGTGSDEDWYHLVLPALIKDDYVYRETGNYIKHNLKPGVLFPEKFTVEQAMAAMGNIQWSQETTPQTGEVYWEEWFQRYAMSELPRSSIKSWSIYGDTASKTNEYNDYSVLQLWATTTRNQGYMVKQWRKKVMIPFLKDEAIKFYNECRLIAGGIEDKSDALKFNIEDKDSGTGLIQSLRLAGYPVNDIQRKEGKYARNIDAADNVKHGNIYLPAGPIGDMVIAEAVRFKADDSHAHDDQIDPMADFINHELPRIVPGVTQGRTTGY